MRQGPHDMQQGSHDMHMTCNTCDKAHMIWTYLEERQKAGLVLGVEIRLYSYSKLLFTELARLRGGKVLSDP